MAILRSLSDWLLKVLAGWRPRVKPRGAPVKVNLGSGVEVAPGWIHLDASIHALCSRAPKPLLRFLCRKSHGVRNLLSEADYVDRLREHDFVFCNFENGLPFPSDSVDYVFSSHVLEHFHREAALRLMHELRRVLKPGGRLRIAVPDLARAMQLYQQGAKSEALDYFFTGERSGLDQHRYMYDFELLASLLAAGGFVDVQQCAYRVGRVPDLDKLDNRPAETLFVEAAKPAH